MNGYGFGSLPATAPNSQLIEMTAVQSSNVSNYNGLTASYQHRFSGWGGGGIFQFNYTYSHAFDLISNGGFNPFNGISTAALANPYNAYVNYGPADYDARHVINANYVWQIPVRRALGGHGWAPLVDGWQVSGAVFYRTGFPYTIIDGQQETNLNALNFFGPYWPTPNNAVAINCGSEIHAGPNAVPCYSVSQPVGNTCVVAVPGDFPIPGCGTALSQKGFRNNYRGPSYWDTDFSFMKSTKIPKWESAQFQLGLQFFNLFNHPNFNLPVNNTADPQFGTIQSAVNPPTSILGSFLGGDASPRLIQLKAQFVFYPVQFGRWLR